MTDKLLPCPFCGCDCIDEYEGDFGNGVYCMQCGVMMGEPIHLDFRSPRVSFEQAMTAWNTRAERTCRMTPDASGDRITTINGDEIFLFRFTCSECGGKTNQPFASYCPNCGAKVVG